MRDLEDNNINYLSNIMNISDIIAAILRETDKEKVLMEDYIIGDIRNVCGNKINKDILDALLTLAKQEYFWLEATNIKIREDILENYITEKLDIILSLEQVLNIGEIVSHVIDFINPFTATHSKGIATVSSKLAKDLSFSEQGLESWK
ncbi:MAG: hypothetical protein U5K53_08375 [Halanaerobiales bacterium]|nr:hypothetical protein [Halanaerobiales bacterium]